MRRLNELIHRLFPDRQLLVRSNDHVRAVTLTRNAQLVMAGLGVCLFGWLAATSAMVLLLNHSLGTSDARFDRQRTAYERLLGDVSLYQDKVASVTRNLRDRQAYLLSLLNAGPGVGAGGDADAARRKAEQEALQSHVQQLDDELAAIAGSSVALEQNLVSVRERLSAALAERDQVAAARADLMSRLQEVQRRQSGEAERNETLRDALGAATQQLARAGEERDRMAKERDGYRDRLAAVEREVFEAQEDQQNLIYRLVERAMDSIYDAERIVALTGIRPEAVLSKKHRVPPSQGGPLVPLDRNVQVAEPVQSALALLDLHLDRWEVLQRLLRAIPFAPPLDQFSLTSGFGPRSDPFTQTASMHQGLDMSAPRKTAIYAPAPGVVIFANRKDRYGKMVDIDHGMGIVTRYGHLDEINVKPGDKVRFRSLIGKVGTTGRSSGAHLHYEVLVQGKPLNPQRFLDVGRYLYKEVDDPVAAKRPPKRPNVARN